jgi:LacI family transcriptional regulator, gluconate utilization system Gnt-I transcriptional repressor
MTVSRYLRTPQLVAEATARKITQALAFTAYSPNFQAGSLASGRSHMVAVIVPNMAHSIFADTLHGLGEALQDADLQMLVASTNYSSAQEETQIRSVLGWGPAALVVTGRHHTPGALALMRAAQIRGIPVVEMWDRSPATEVCEFAQIGFSHFEAGALMAKTLLTRGYAQLVFMDSGVEEDFRAHERSQGFLQAAKAAQCVATRLTAPALDPMDAGKQCFEAWQRQHNDPVSCGFGFANDLLGSGAMLAALNAGCLLPESIGMLGFGDFPVARHWAGGLSTLRVDGHHLGQESARHLLQCLSIGKGLSQHVPASQAIDLDVLIRAT